MTGEINFRINHCNYVIIKSLIISDKECNSGGVFTCLNGGEYLSTGSCKCIIVYSGITCSEC